MRLDLIVDILLIKTLICCMLIFGEGNLALMSLKSLYIVDRLISRLILISWIERLTLIIDNRLLIIRNALLNDIQGFNWYLLDFISGFFILLDDTNKSCFLRKHLVFHSNICAIVSLFINIPSRGKLENTVTFHHFKVAWIKLVAKRLLSKGIFSWFES